MAPKPPPASASKPAKAPPLATGVAAAKGAASGDKGSSSTRQPSPRGTAKPDSARKLAKVDKVDSARKEPSKTNATPRATKAEPASKAETAAKPASPPETKPKAAPKKADPPPPVNLKDEAASTANTAEETAAAAAAERTAAAAKKQSAAHATKRAAGKYPARVDGDPSRHSIAKVWTKTFDPVLLFNCVNSRVELLNGDYVSYFGDAHEGQLKTATGEAVGRVTVAREKAEPFMNRVDFKNRWMVGTEYGLVHDGLDRHATIDVAIEWKRDDNGQKVSVALRVWPWISYACTAGSRLKIMLPAHEFDGACVTVQRVLDDDRCVCTIDVVDKETLVDPSPETTLRTSRHSYAPGTRLLVLQRFTMRDTTVIEWLGAGGGVEDVILGGRHRLRYEAGPSGEAEEEVRDLNDYNHSQQSFDSEAAYDETRCVYCAGIVASENEVEDAITGNKLRIEDQMICVATQNLGEAIKHADPTWNSMKDVHELVDLLLAPSHKRTRGVHLAQPTLVRAGPGTGKTWMVKQAAYKLAKRLGAADCDKCRGKVFSENKPKPCEHGGMRLVPLVVYVQRIVRLVREQGEESAIIAHLLKTRTWLLWYIERNFEGAERRMLVQAHQMRALVILIDGVDEAAGMKEAIEEFVHKEVAVSGNRLVVTSRPEGVRLELYEDRFIVINLLQLTDEQQRKVINSQMKGNVFFDHLISLSVIRKGQDEIYEQTFPPETRARRTVEGFEAPNLFLLEGGAPNPAQRQHDVTGDHVLREQRAGSLAELTTVLKSTRLKRMHELLTSPTRPERTDSAAPSAPSVPLIRQATSMSFSFKARDDHTNLIVGVDDDELPTYLQMLDEAFREMAGDATPKEVERAVRRLPLPMPTNPAPDQTTALEEKRMLHHVATSLGLLVLRKRTDDRSFVILKEKRRQINHPMHAPQVKIDTAVATPRDEQHAPSSTAAEAPKRAGLAPKGDTPPAEAAAEDAPPLEVEALPPVDPTDLVTLFEALPDPPAPAEPEPPAMSAEEALAALSSLEALSSRLKNLSGEERNRAFGLLSSISEAWNKADLEEERKQREKDKAERKAAKLAAKKKAAEEKAMREAEEAAKLAALDEASMKKAEELSFAENALRKAAEAEAEAEAEAALKAEEAARVAQVAEAGEESAGNGTLEGELDVADVVVEGNVSPTRHSVFAAVFGTSTGDSHSDYHALADGAIPSSPDGAQPLPPLVPGIDMAPSPSHIPNLDTTPAPNLDTAPSRPPNPYIVEKALCVKFVRNPVYMKDIFREWDTDGSGEISLDEFRQALTMLGINGFRDVQEADVDALFQLWDADGSGEIDFDELAIAIKAAIKAEKQVRRVAIDPALSRVEGQIAIPGKDKLTLTESSWAKVAARTDELYEVLDLLYPLFAKTLKCLLSEEQLPAEVLENVEMLNPVEVHSQASLRPKRSFPSASGLEEATVHDAIQARLTCTSGDQMAQIGSRFLKGYTCEATGLSLEVISLENTFADLRPTHLRNLTFALKLSKGSMSTYAEVQVQHANIRKYHEDSDAKIHYEYFRSRVSTGTGTDDDAAAHVDLTLEKVLSFLIEAAAVPVLLSLLVLVFTTTGAAAGEEDLDMLPQSSYQLYSMATQSAVVQRLLAMGRAVSTEAGEAAEDAAAELEAQEARRERKQTRKAATVKVGAKVAQGESANELGLNDAEIYSMYKMVAKVLALFAQGRMGLSELKQAYVTKDKRIRPLVLKMLDSVLKEKSTAMEAAGLNMLRLVAVDNQRHGRREFTSAHVASSLMKGGRELEMPLWLRLDVEDAGVTLIKTLESLTDTAPALYQFKHLSFQEGLFARDLLGLVDKKQWKGWETDKTASEFLNNAYMNNVCRIASGELGKRLAFQRPVWSFVDDARLSWVGKAALWALVKSNDYIRGLHLSGNAVGPGMGGAEADVDCNGLASLFSACPNLELVNLGHNNLGAFSNKQLNRWVRHIAANLSLTELDVQSNNLGADGVNKLANSLRLCLPLKSLNLSRNQPGGRPEALVQLVKDHAKLELLSIIEDDEKHLTSKAKAMIGEAMRVNPAHKLAYVACDAFELKPSTKTLKWTSTLPADVTLLAGALRSNTSLTALAFDGISIAEQERTQLGKALLENSSGCVGYCDDFELTPSTTELRWDLKDSTKARKGLVLLMALLRANTKVTRVTLVGLNTDALTMLTQATRTNTTLQELVLEHTVQKLKGQATVVVSLPVQELVGAMRVESIDLSAAGELTKTSLTAVGALLASNTSVKSLRLSGTKLGDEAGTILPVLGDLCKTGSLTALDLSDIGFSDRGARKLFDSMMTGEYPSLRVLNLAGNTLKDIKVNGLIEMLRMDECSLSSLDVSNNPLSGAMVMRSLKFNASLEYLNVRGTELDDTGVRDFGALLLAKDCTCPLRALSIDVFEVREDTTSLSFAGKGNISSSILTLLCGILKLNKTISSLDLNGVDMDAPAAAALETALVMNQSLTSIDLRNNPKLWSVKDNGEESSEGLEAIVRGLHANSTVQKVYMDALELLVSKLKGTTAEPVLELSYAGSAVMGNVSAALLCALVQKNAVAKMLDLSEVKTADRLGHAVGRCLRLNTSITTINLRDSQLRDEGVGALADGLKQNKASKVRVLDLSSNGIGAAGAEKLAGLLSLSASLAKLDLSANKLGSSGTEALRGSLRDNGTLTALNLRDNDIDVAGATALATALRTNGALSTLWLGKNKVGDEGVIALVEALKESASKGKGKIAYLDLHKNNITKVGIASLTTLVSESPTLAALGLAGTKMQFTETEVMQSCAKENPEIGRAKAVRLWMGADMNKWPDF
ncbi:protein nlrc3 [Chrysochromulina tobinii]|uniref:Protein nlrc3 n=1 Tax=Chrysochromulina tobinii TaxID=1460289 RepID=A0A0M0K012_9EUKA|nr:protein nlrc3 [Chrysochromulina tobinii]|eukprot:KOO32236.1 protein nlrc3 [Chrysochromulina sp. CCMP291]